MKFIPEISQSHILAASRVIVGGVLLAMVMPLMDRSFIDALPGQLNSFAMNNPYPLFKAICYAFLIPQAQSIGAVFAIAQLMLGLSYVLGFLSRTFSLMGAISTGIMFVACHHVGWVYQQHFILMGMVFLLFAALDIGKYYGIDGFLFGAARNQMTSPPKKRAYNKSKPGKTAKMRPLVSASNTERDYDYDDADDYEEAYA